MSQVMRQALEALCAVRCCISDNTAAARTADAAIASLEAALNAPQPEWVMVPREPTNEMLDAAKPAGLFASGAHIAWQAMLAAAPTAPPAPQGEQDRVHPAAPGSSTLSEADEREAFEKWWRSSKYCQVVFPRKGWEQIALDGWQARAAVSATPSGERQADEREALAELIADFRLSNWTDDAGDGLPLVDRITSGGTIGPGREQIELLADEVACFYAARAALAQEKPRHE